MIRIASKYRRHNALTTMFLEVIMTPKTVPKIAEKKTEIKAIFAVAQSPHIKRSR